MWGMSNDPISTADIPEWNLQDRLLKARNHAHLHQEQLATRLGVNVRTIQRYEAGTSTTKRPLLLAWAMACGVSAQWLVGGGPEDGVTGPVTLW